LVGFSVSRNHNNNGIGQILNSENCLSVAAAGRKFGAHIGSQITPGANQSHTQNMTHQENYQVGIPTVGTCIPTGPPNIYTVGYADLNTASLMATPNPKRVASPLHAQLFATQSNIHNSNKQAQAVQAAVRAGFSPQQSHINQNILAHISPMKNHAHQLHD
jgi:hypothetical protein